MARKNAKIAERGVSGLGVIFDSTTRSVMAQDNPQDSIHQKVAAVKEVVTGRNKHEITLVLQHFDNDVQSTIQSFLDNGAKDVLQEWQSTTGSNNKPSNKKKKKNRRKDEWTPSGSTVDLSDEAVTRCEGGTTGGDPLPQRLKTGRQTAKPSSDKAESRDAGSSSSNKSTEQNPVIPLVNRHSPAERSASNTNSTYQPDPQVPATARVTVPSSSNATSPPRTTVLSNSSLGNKQTVDSKRNNSLSNQKHSGIAADADDSAHRSESMAPSNRGPQKGKPRPAHLDVTKSQRERTTSEASVSSMTTDKSKKPHAGLEKSLKDLTRQTMSLNRQKLLLSEGFEQSHKLISAVYADAIERLKDREVDHLFQLNKVKNEAQDLLEKRQGQGAALKVRMDRAPRMNDVEILELRADVKHFVSERKIDDDLGSTKRYVCDLDHLKEEIDKFGQVVGVKAPYSARRPSVSSITSSIVSHDDLLSPLSPWLPTSHPPSASITPVTPAPGPLVPAKAPPSVITGAKVISQSESVTQYESSELGQKRTKDTKPAGRGPRPNQSPRRRQGQQSQGRQGQGHISEDQAAKGHKGQGDGPTRDAKDAEDGPDKQKSRSARRRQNLRARQREQKLSQEGTVDGKTQGNSQSHQEKKESPKHESDATQRQGDRADKSGRSPRNRRTPSPKKRAQVPEGQKDEGIREVPGSGNRQRRPRSQSNKSRSNDPVQDSLKQEDRTADDSDMSATSKAVTVSVKNPETDTKSDYTEETVPEVNATDDLAQSVPEVTETRLQVNVDIAKVTVDPLMSKDINENDATKDEEPMINGTSEGEKVAKTATVSIVPKKPEVTKATISINGEEEGLPQRKVRPTRRRGPGGVSRDSEQATNGICDGTGDEESGHPIMNGEICASVNGNINGHDSP